MHKIILLVLAALTFVPSLTASAAPAPTLFAYNDTAKLCGTFRDGDERTSYGLPDGWQTYSYDKTQLKTTQQYCDALGYANVGSITAYLNLEPTVRVLPGDLSAGRRFNYPLLVGLIIFLLAVVGLVIFALNKKSSKKTNNKILRRQ